MDPVDGGASGPDAGSAPISGPGCGNGIVEGAESCDGDGKNTATCDSDCSLARCGDGLLNVPAGEECDPGGQTATCTKDCKVAECPEDCRCENYETGAYAFCGEPLIWSKAETQCEKYGGSLTALETIAEHRFVLSRSLGQRFWLGGTDAATEGEWFWTSTGSQFWAGAADGSGFAPLYFVWNLAQPSNNDDVEHCLEMASTLAAAGWNDRSCVSAAPYACERAFVAPATCGDGKVDEQETCDEGGATKSCDADCTVPVCGDGRVNVLAGEICDDGNSDPMDACDAACSPTGLVGHWPMNEAAGVVFRDWVATNDLDPVGFNIGAAQFVALDGKSDRLVIPSGGNPDGLNVGGDLSVSLMAKFGVDTAGFRPLVVHGTAAGSRVYIAVAAGKLDAGMTRMDAEGTEVAQVETSLGVLANDDKWHHVVLRFGDGVWTLLVDGQVRDSVAGQAAPSKIDADWGVGGFADGTGARFMGGLRSLRVYASSLTDQQIDQLGASD